ncbi:hypothetical protein [Methylosinus sporium]|uniref:Twin-arginine translocation pathway signal n=1 Tax=Methylosinus sporium TaxID=428 RepID=A0A2U1SRY7_METSR|nr:hypothetical protein [Methylosinus sporium]PWB94369.1 hypothetical protein C5689_08595 [Methylosinus sporium]
MSHKRQFQIRCRALSPALAVAAAFGLAACAKPTREIEPAPVDPGLFIGADCPQLVARRARIAQALIFAGSAQDQLAADDRTRTFGVPTPMGTPFDADREPQIARLKGELHAVNAQMDAQRCGPDFR